MVSNLAVSTWEDWVPIYCVLIMFRGRPFCLLVLLILKSFRVVLLVNKVSRSRFPFWRFCWVYSSLLWVEILAWKCPNWWMKANLRSRSVKPLLLIWDFSSVISSGVYSRRSFCHRSCLALFTGQQSSPWTFDLVIWSCTCLTFKINDSAYQSIPCFYS